MEVEGHGMPCPSFLLGEPHRATLSMNRTLIVALLLALDLPADLSARIRDGVHVDIEPFTGQGSDLPWGQCRCCTRVCRGTSSMRRSPLPQGDVHEEEVSARFQQALGSTP